MLVVVGLWVNPYAMSVFGLFGSVYGCCVCVCGWFLVCSVEFCFCVCFRCVCLVFMMRAFIIFC